MFDKPELTAEEKMADALPANAKYVAAHQKGFTGKAAYSTSAYSSRSDDQEV